MNKLLLGLALTSLVTVTHGSNEPLRCAFDIDGQTNASSKTPAVASHRGGTGAASGSSAASPSPRRLISDCETIIDALEALRIHDLHLPKVGFTQLTSTVWSEATNTHNKSLEEVRSSFSGTKSKLRRHLAAMALKLSRIQLQSEQQKNLSLISQALRIEQNDPTAAILLDRVQMQKNKMQELQEKIHQDNLAIQALREALDAQKIQNAVLAAELGILRTVNEQLQSQLAAKPAHAEEWGDVRTQLTRMQLESDNLNRKFDSVRSAGRSTARSRVADAAAAALQETLKRPAVTLKTGSDSD